MKKLFFLFVLFCSTPLIQPQTVSTFYFDANELKIPIDNKGILANVNIDPYGSSGKYKDGGFIYSAGFLLSGYNADTLWGNGVAPSNLVEDYISGKAGSDPSDPKNKIYVVSIHDQPFGSSWQNYRDAVELGADFYDGNNDGVYNPVDLNSNGIWDTNEDKPDIIGDLTAWTLYNDGAEKSQRRFLQDPLGIEIHQRVFAFSNQSSPLRNSVFIRYRLINTGTVSTLLDSIIFSMYSDPDIGDAGDELVGTDSILNSAFVYNDSADFQYSNKPPALYMTFVQNPYSYIAGETFIDNNSNNIFDLGIDTPVDSAINNFGPLIGSEKIMGAKNLSIFSTSYAVNGDNYMYEPRNANQLRNLLLGIDTKGAKFNPCDLIYGKVVGEDCAAINYRFIFSGNPINNTGWINKMGLNNRAYANTGPFKLEAGKPVDIIVAYNAGQGTDNLNSILKAKETAQASIDFYKSNFTNIPVGISEEKNVQPNDFELVQNYPNPFNPTTKIRYTIPNVGDENFRPVQLKIYDVLGNEIAALVDKEQTPANYEVVFNGEYLPSGVYFYILKIGEFSSARKMMLLK